MGVARKDETGETSHRIGYRRSAPLSVRRPPQRDGINVTGSADSTSRIPGSEPKVILFNKGEPSQEKWGQRPKRRGKEVVDIGA